MLPSGAGVTVEGREKHWKGTEPAQTQPSVSLPQQFSIWPHTQNSDTLWAEGKPCLPPVSNSLYTLSRVRLFATPWTIAHQSMGFSRQEYWSGLPFPSPGESSQSRDWIWVSHIAGRFFTIWATREATRMLLDAYCLRLNGLTDSLCRMAFDGEFLGGPVIRTGSFHCWGPRFVPGWGTKIPQGALLGQN